MKWHKDSKTGVAASQEALDQQAERLKKIDGRDRLRGTGSSDPELVAQAAKRIQALCDESVRLDIRMHDHLDFFDDDAHWDAGVAAGLLEDTGRRCDNGGQELAMERPACRYQRVNARRQEGRRLGSRHEPKIGCDLAQNMRATAV